MWSLFGMIADRKPLKHLKALSLKHLLFEVLITHPISPIILAVDTSYTAIGIILLQIDEEGRRRPARYGSIPINDRESRYSQPKLELYGLFRALRHYRLYLIGVKNLHVEVDARISKECSMNQIFSQMRL